MFLRSKLARHLLSVQFFSSNRFRPKNTYSVNNDNYLHGLACFPEDAYLQKHPAPTESEGIQWRSKLLVIKNGKVFGTYQPPPVHPFPQSFAPEGISIEDYKHYINMHDSFVFLFVVSRHCVFCGFMKKDASWASRPYERQIEKNFKDSKLRTTRNSAVFTDVCEYLRSNESEIAECPTLWYRVSPEHGILIPASQSNRRIRAEEHFGAAKWHEEDERFERIMPHGGDPRWVPMPSCAWPQLMHRQGIQQFMNTGIVEIA